MKKATKMSLSFLFIFLLVMSGCTEKYESEYDPGKDPLVNTPEMFDAPPEDLSQIAMDESVIISMRSAPKSMNPLFSSSIYDNLAASMVFDRLFITDKDLNIFANEAVVESWEKTEDYKQITVHIRKDLKWQDGHDLKADDFAFAMEMLKEDKVPCYTFKSDVKNLEKVELLDDYTLRYTLAKPVANYLDLISMPYAPLPKHLFANEEAIKANPDLKTGEYYRKLAMEPVGNGPYKLIEWKENEKMVFERWEDYQGPKPYLKRITFKFQPDISMALLSFKAGDVDIMYYLGGKQCARETNDQEFADIGRKYVMPQWTYDYTGWNMDGSNPFFIDKLVRKAMAHVHNQKLQSSKLYDNMLNPCTGIFHWNSWMASKNIVPIEYDLDKAAELLDQAGWELADDGWRYKDVNFVIVNTIITDLNTGEEREELKKVYLQDGQEYELKEGETFVESGTEHCKFEFTLLSTLTSGSIRPSTLIFKTDLMKIGVNMEVRLMEWTSFMSRTLAHDMQAWAAAWGAGTDPDGSKGCFRTVDYNDGRNYGGYANPEVDRLFEEGLVEFDRSERAKIYGKIQEIIYEDQPYMFMDTRVAATAVHKRIRGMEKSDFGYCEAFPGFFRLWVPKDEGIRPVSD